MVWPAQVLAAVACIALFAMMLITFVDVAGRYLFSQPLPAAYEMIALTMPCIIFCGLPAVALREGHVTIDLLDAFLPTGIQRWQHRLVHWLSAAIMGLIAWRLAMRSYDHFRFDEVTDELYLPLWWFSAAMAALSVVGALSLFLVGCVRPAESDS